MARVTPEQHLVDACFVGDVGLIQSILDEYRISPNCTTANNTPLCMACLHGGSLRLGLRRFRRGALGFALCREVLRDLHGDDPPAVLRDPRLEARDRVRALDLELHPALDLQQLLRRGGLDLLDQFGKDPEGTIDSLKGLFDRGKRKRDREKKDG